MATEFPMIVKQELKSNLYSVHIDSDIEEPENYRDLIQLLFMAGEEDEINFYINSGGGHLDSALAIIEGIKSTQAHVRCIILGACHSAASMISMYCHEMVILDSAHSLIHTASFGSVGNTNNVKAHTDFTVRQVEKFLHNTYDGFLTDHELSQVKSGVELWFDAEELRTRIAKRVEYMKKQQEKEAKEAAKKVKPKSTTRRTVSESKS